MIVNVYYAEKTLLSILIPSVMSYKYGQFVDHCVTQVHNS